MAKGEKPFFSVNVVDAVSKVRTNLFAYWRNEKGYPSGMLDRSVKAIKVLLDDGSVVLIKRDGNKTSHFINGYENSDDKPNGKPSMREVSTVEQGWPKDDFGNDDIPF